MLIGTQSPICFPEWQVRFLEPGPRFGEVIAPGLDFVVPEALLLMTMTTERSLRFLFRYSGQLLAIVSLDANCAFL